MTTAKLIIISNKAVAMKGLTLSLLHLHFAFCISNLNFPPKNPNFSDFGSGKNFGFGSKFYDRAKFLGSGEKFMFRRKLWVWEERTWWIPLMMHAKSAQFLAAKILEENAEN